jgi:hypothetical protein
MVQGSGSRHMMAQVVWRNEALVSEQQNDCSVGKAKRRRELVGSPDAGFVAAEAVMVAMESYGEHEGARAVHKEKAA